MDFNLNSGNYNNVNQFYKKIEMTSYLLMFVALVSILKLQFVSLMFSIALTFIFMDKITYFIVHFFEKTDKKRRFSCATPENIRMLSSLIVGAVLVIFFGLFSTWLINFLSPSNLQEMFSSIEQILESQKNSKYLPDFIYQYLPSNFDDVKNQSIDLLKNYAIEIKNVGKYGLTFVAYIILGCIIGGMLNIAYSNHKNIQIQITDQYNQTQFVRPLSYYLKERIVKFKNSFELVFLAQIKISLVNTVLTSLYIYVALPMFGYELPFKNTVILLTFLFGLIPVLGNLISNTIIIVLSLGIGLNLAIVSLLYLVIIHKLEYFLDAKIIGSQIEAKTWEILLTLIIFETLFGVSGIIVGSIYYCYLKEELKNKNLI